MYATKMPEGSDSRILFLDRIQEFLFSDGLGNSQNSFNLYLTGSKSNSSSSAMLDHPGAQLFERRFSPEDFLSLLPSTHSRSGTVVYVCGPPEMTDEVIAFLKGLEGMVGDQVLCEKWW